MRLDVLSPDEVLAGYDAVSRLYPHIPPMSTWRAWECATYRRYALPEPVLDVGCGDGSFFRLLWPTVRDVVGVEMGPGVAEAARRSGVYREVHVAPAHQAPVPDEAFASAFANCSLEHLDEAGFDVEAHIFILPKLTGRLFLLLDQLWHVPRPAGELGDVLLRYLASLPNFPAAFRQILAGVLRMEPDWSTGRGAVFYARQRQ